MINQPSDRKRAKPETSAEYRSCFPKFLWLLRDVTLEVPKGRTPQQFITDQVFTQDKAVGEAIMTLFPSEDCKLLPMPTANKDILKHIEDRESELEPEFQDAVTRLTEYLRENVKVKHGFSHGQRVDGPTLVLLLEQYLEAVNTPGTIPSLENTWNTVVEMRCGEVINSLVKEYECEMERALHNKLPVEEEATPEENEENSHPDQHQQQVYLMEVHSQLLRRKMEKLLKEIKYITSAENAHRPGAAVRYKKELVKSLQSKIIETKSDKMKGQVVTGGVIAQFVYENDEKSRAYCIECFDEVSAPLLKNLRSIMESATVTTAAPDAPRYTFQHFIDDRANLQMEYFARAIGPAKQKVWEEKVGSLKEWESVVLALGGQKDKFELYQQLTATADRENELRDLVSHQSALNSRLKSEQKYLQTHLMHENEEIIQQIKQDAAEKLAEERRKLEVLENRQEIKESELEAAKQQVEKLLKDKERAEQRQKQQEIEVKEYESLKLEHVHLLTELEKVRAKQEKTVKELEAGVFIAILSN